MAAFFQNPLIYIVSLLAVGFIFCQILTEDRIDIVRV